jgi:hypothetical protein
VKVILFIFGAFLTLFGCADNPGIVELPGVNDRVAFIPMESVAVQLFSESKIIEGETGGKIDFDFSNSVISVKGILEFPETSFIDQEQIFVAVPQTIESVAALDLNPTKLKFEKPIFLTLKFSGLTIEEGDLINFNYVDEKGDIADVEYRRLIIDYDDGWALVVNAKIYQFARFGFTRRIIN